MGFSASFVTTPQTAWQCATCRLASRAREGLLAAPNNPLIVAAVQAICAGGPHADLIESGWRAVDERMRRIEEALHDRQGATVYRIGEAG